MPFPVENLPRIFDWHLLGGLGWLALVVGASITYRKSRGKTIYPLRPEGAIFHEGWTSGYSNRDLLTKMWGARNCLMVSVLKDELIIQPHFPFNLMFLPEVCDLDYRISRANIRSIKPSRFFYFWKIITIDFVDSQGKDHSMSLALRKRDDFLRVMGITDAL